MYICLQAKNIWISGFDKITTVRMNLFNMVACIFIIVLLSARESWRVTFLVCLVQITHFVGGQRGRWDLLCLFLMTPDTRFTKDLRAYYPNLVNIHLVLAWKIILRSGHNFAHVTTAGLSLHVQNCGLVVVLKSKWEQLELSRDFNYELINPLWNVSLLPLFRWITIQGAFQKHLRAPKSKSS